MSTDKRVFCASFSVKVGTKRVKFELAKAEIYGGTSGYRLRIDRRWHDTPDGKTQFLDAAQICRLAATLGMGEGTKTQPIPKLKHNQRVRVITERDADGEAICAERTWTSSPPVLGYTGKWQIAVSLLGQGVVFVNCDDVEVIR